MTKISKNGTKISKNERNALWPLRFESKFSKTMCSNLVQDLYGRGLDNHAFGNVIKELQNRFSAWDLGSLIA